MVGKINETIKLVLESKKYLEFIKNHPSYQLVHCFSQLDKNGLETKQWQIGFYSEEKDNMITFTTNPINKGEFEEAFKDGGTIPKLESKDLMEADRVMDLAHELLNKEYSNEIINSFIIIIQTIDEKPTYNITAISQSFSMITIQIHAQTGETIDHKKRSILDLKKDDE